MKKILVIILLVAAACKAYGAVKAKDAPMGGVTNIAPAYFGPNAFPVIDMSDGSLSERICFELAGDYYLGRSEFSGTGDIFARLRIPLFTPRVNFVVWMPIAEFYYPTYLAPEELPEGTGYGDLHYNYGDVYISTDALVCRERKYVPAMVIRAGMKTASGGGFSERRTYDAPGYFFDYTIAKQFTFGASFLTSLRIAGSVGFLCWQTDNGRQNDAVMYGALIALTFKYFRIEETFSGYYGWENSGDRPMTNKLKLSAPVKDFEPYFMYQYGIKDYPYHQFRIGIIYKIDFPYPK